MSLIGTKAPEAKRLTGERSKPRVVYQKSAEVQRTYVTVPAATKGWVSTGINPQALGGRALMLAWNAKVEHEPKRETVEAFKKRLTNVSIRHLRDDKRAWPGQVFRPQGITECVAVEADKELPLIFDQPLCFDEAPGEIQIKFNGARASDRGAYRVFFASAAYSQSDAIVNDGVASKVELYEGAIALPAPPPL